MLSYTVTGSSLGLSASQASSASGSYSSTYRAGFGTTTTIATLIGGSTSFGAIIRVPGGSTESFTSSTFKNTTSTTGSGIVTGSYPHGSGSSYTGVTSSSYIAAQGTTSSYPITATVYSSSSYTSSVGTNTRTITTSCTTTKTSNGTLPSSYSTYSLYGFPIYSSPYTYVSANALTANSTILQTQSLMEQIWICTNSVSNGFVSDVGFSTTKATLQVRGQSTVGWTVTATPVNSSATFSNTFITGFDNPISSIVKSTFSMYINSTTAFTVGFTEWDLNFLPPTAISSSVSSASSYVTIPTTITYPPGTSSGTYAGPSFPAATYPIAVRASSSFASVLNRISDVTTTSSYFYYTTSGTSHGVQLGGAGGTIPTASYTRTTKTSAGTGSGYTSGIIGSTGAFGGGATTNGVSITEDLTYQYMNIAQTPTVHYPCLKIPAFVLPNSAGINFTDGSVYQDLGTGPLIYYPFYSNVEIAGAGGQSAYVPALYPGTFTAAQSATTTTTGTTTSETINTQFWTYSWSSGTIQYTKQSTSSTQSTGSLHLSPTPISNGYFYSSSQLSALSAMSTGIVGVVGIVGAGGPMIPENLVWTLGVGQGLYKVSTTKGTSSSSFTSYIPYFSSFTLNSSQSYAFGLEPYVTSGWGGEDVYPYLTVNSSTIAGANNYPNGL